MQRFTGLFIFGFIGIVVLGAIVGGVYFVFADFSPSGNPNSITLSSTSNVAEYKGFKISLAPDQVSQGFTVTLNSLAAADFQKNTGDPSRANLPAYLTPASAIYTIQTNGTSPTLIAVSIKLTNDLINDPLIDLYAWNGTSWIFLPGQRSGDRLVATFNGVPQAVAVFRSAPTIQVAAAALDVNQTLGEVSSINVMGIGGLTLQANGSLNGSLAGGFTAGQGYAVMPLVRAPDDGGAAVNAFLADQKARTQLIGSLIDLSNNPDYNGVILEFGKIDPKRSAAFTSFASDLNSALKQKKKSLVVVVPTPTIENASYSAGGYDLRSLGAAVDVIEIPLSNDLTSVGNGEAEHILTWATTQTNRYKIRLLTSTLSADRVNGVFNRVPTNNTLKAFGSATLKTDLAKITAGSNVEVALNGKVSALDYDSSSFTPRFNYTDDSNVAHTVFLVTTETLSRHFALAQKFNLGGVAVRDLYNPGNPPGMINSLVQYKLKNNAIVSSNVALNYTVNNSKGVVAQATGVAGKPFVWKAGEPGNYSISAKIAGIGDVPLGSVEVVVPQATPTPTPRPTLRPVAVNPAQPQPTTAPGQPTNTPKPAPVIGGGGAWGAFELGGQTIHGGIPGVGAMRKSGMTWVKVQLNSMGEDAGPAINNAHAQGFKILISMVEKGAPATDPGYQQSVANFFAGVAAKGADAIEVWNEPNLVTDWPSGQTTGSSYVGMLSKSYAAIKAANGSTIVISAAPSPTGFYGGCGAGCDDKPWLEQFVAADGLKYTDCLGIHYNEGIVSPKSIGTDPRDNHYTRYYATMINTYASIIKTSRPLCFTELGYLTGEGYSPPLAQAAPQFGWAGNTTVAQHAQWLKEAAELSKANSNIRLMIVFNVDLTHYGADPRAGYAIIRPGGACPACDTLASVMGSR